MFMLGAGISLWAIAHLMPSLAPGLRTAVQARLGPKLHRALVGLVILVGLGLMIVGWRSIRPEPAYTPPAWGRHANMALMFLAVLLLGAANGASRIRQWIRHPMLTGVLLWAIGHLLANGDNRSTVLFGGLGLWALVSIFTLSRKEGAWVKPEKVASLGREFVSLAVTLVVYAALLWGHAYFAGAALLPLA